MHGSIVITLLAAFAFLIASFCFFSFFNYLYAVSSCFKRRIARCSGPEPKIAVVICAFNEHYVLDATIEACNRLTYNKKTIVLADDSSDQDLVANLRRFAKDQGCCMLSDSRTNAIIQGEVWESQAFVLIHRDKNVGFKGGSLSQVCPYLEQRGFEFIYLLDADWQPQPDTLERTLEVMCANPEAAFVQTMRITLPEGMTRFQRYVALNEEGGYYVDFPGRQTLGHPVLFTGCCTLLRLKAVREVGGFRPGHLTEDLDLSNRFWLAGWKGIYLSDIKNYGEVPFSYDHFRRQQERWASGTARSLREYTWPILTSKHLSLAAKLSVLRQNYYYTTAVLTMLAILLGIGTLAWLKLTAGSYKAEVFLYFMQKYRVLITTLISFCILSTWIQPLLLVYRTRRYADLAHLPMTIWYGWSLILPYFWGNIRGFRRAAGIWFRTPKLKRGATMSFGKSPVGIRAQYIALIVVFLLMFLVEGDLMLHFNPFALLIVPALIIAIFK